MQITTEFWYHFSSITGQNAKDLTPPCVGHACKWDLSSVPDGRSEPSSYRGNVAATLQSPDACTLCPSNHTFDRRMNLSVHAHRHNHSIVVISCKRLETTLIFITCGGPSSQFAWESLHLGFYIINNRDPHFSLSKVSRFRPVVCQICILFCYFFFYLFIQCFVFRKPCKNSVKNKIAVVCKYVTLCT